MKTMKDFNWEEKKKLYRTVAEMAKSTPSKDIANKLEVKPWVITGMLARMRKNSIPIPYFNQSILTPDFIKELTDIFGNS